MNNEKNEKNEKKTVSIKIQWTSEHEEILIDWADKAMCYRWLHAKSNQNYSCMNAWFTIPVIVMSTLTGTANFAQDRFQAEARTIAAMLIGGVNIVAGILTTVQQFLKITELNEAHRVASISWDKFYRNIKVELAKKPLERMPITEMLKISKEEFNRLMETSPIVNDDVIKEFKKTFYPINLDADPKNWSESERMFQDLKKPEICDVLESTRYSVYKPKIQKESQTKNLDEFKEKIQIELPKSFLKEEKQINKFVTDFITEFSRPPNNDEIISELQDTIDIKILNSILKNKIENINNDEIRLEINENI